MIPILTPEQAAESDRLSAEAGVTVEELMERAGWAVARAATDLAGGAYGRRAVVVCGKGNNGGDGLVAARHLERWGMGVSVLLLAPPEGFRGAARTSFHRYAEGGGRWGRHSDAALSRELRRADVAVDAIFGTGFRGAPRGEAAPAIGRLGGFHAEGGAVVAVDIPSGVDGATGGVEAEAVAADLTVTFGALKPALVFHPGAGRAGLIEVVDIGLVGVLSDVHLLERRDAVQLLGPPRPPEANKGSAGRALVVAGSRAMTGAAVLAATAAYRAGAGLVTLAVPEGVLPVVEGAVAEAVFLPLPETKEGTISEEAWPLLLEKLESVRAGAIGPGLTTNPSTVDLVRRFVAECPVPFVLDADGLNAFAGHGRDLARHASEMVITPHPGEFGRLSGMEIHDVVKDPVGHALQAVREFDCRAVLLKGSPTVVGEPGSVLVNSTGGPNLATGGTGDVLTGVIAGLMARGLEPGDAAVAGAYVHGAAGDLVRRDFGDGTVAPDLLTRLPQVVRRLQEEHETLWA
jgi:hydroxyethylthiazole kinase-like uncharacterized protein yjeF